MVCLSHIKLYFRYYRIQEDDTISLEFIFWGFINYKIEVPVLILQQKLSGFTLKTRTEVETGGDYSEELMGKSAVLHFNSLIKVLQKVQDLVLLFKDEFEYFLRHLKVKRFAWNISIGTRDAAVTAILTGLIWIITGNITSAFYQKIAADWHKPELKVSPNFKKEVFSTSLNCIFKIRVGNIMVTGIKILKKKVTRLGGNKDGRTSYRRFDENRNGKHQGNG